MASLSETLRQIKKDQAEMEKFLRQGPSPTVCRVMAKFSSALGHPDDAEQWRKAAAMPKSEGNA